MGTLNEKTPIIKAVRYLNEDVPRSVSTRNWIIAIVVVSLTVIVLTALAASAGKVLPWLLLVTGLAGLAFFGAWWMRTVNSDAASIHSIIHVDSLGVTLFDSLIPWGSITAVVAVNAASTPSSVASGTGISHDAATTDLYVAVTQVPQMRHFVNVEKTKSYHLVRVNFARFLGPINARDGIEYIMKAAQVRSIPVFTFESFASFYQMADAGWLDTRERALVA